MVLDLLGCTPTPMASYLKGMGVFRLVTEQKDASCRGWWADGGFKLEADLDRDELVQFLATEYCPTPIVAPWSGGSGFYPNDKQEGIAVIANSEDARFGLYREVIAEIKSWPESPVVPDTPGVIKSGLEQALPDLSGKPEKDVATQLNALVEAMPSDAEAAGAWDMSLDDVEQRSKDSSSGTQAAWKAWWAVIKKARSGFSQVSRSAGKEELLNICRARLPRQCLDWLDAAFVLRADGTPSYNYALGTGGNEGRLEYSNNFMQRLVELLLVWEVDRTSALLRSSLLGETVDGLIKASFGQSHPGRAGGYNQGMGIEAKNFKINPWDYVLMLEGSLVLAGSVARRSPADSSSQLSSPFTVRFSPVGFSSSEPGETARGETWLPLWRRPCPLVEVRYLFGEGRATLDRKPAQTGLDFSRAVGSLGVDRGIDSFERYVYLPRRGQSYVALPAGTIPVRFSPMLEIMNDLDSPLRSLEGFLGQFKNVPATFVSARRNIDEAMFACAMKPQPQSFIRLLRVLGRMERLLALRDRSKKPQLNRPLTGLSPRWFEACDDGRLEVRLAASLASVTGAGYIGPMATYMAGIDPRRPWAWGEGDDKLLWAGSTLDERLGGVVVRRMMDAGRRPVEHPPFAGRLSLTPQDVALYLQADIDHTALEEMLWGFLMVDWSKPGLAQARRLWTRPVQSCVVPREWSLLKLLHLPRKVRDVAIRMEPRISRLLATGRVEEACQVAARRLRTSNLAPLDATYGGGIDHMRLLASLLIPVGDQAYLERAVLQPPSSTKR